jgi:hypothetical protein
MRLRVPNHCLLEGPLLARWSGLDGNDRLELSELIFSICSVTVVAFRAPRSTPSEPRH